MLRNTRPLKVGSRRPCVKKGFILRKAVINLRKDFGQKGGQGSASISRQKGRGYIRARKTKRGASGQKEGNGPAAEGRRAVNENGVGAGEPPTAGQEGERNNNGEERGRFRPSSGKNPDTKTENACTQERGKWSRAGSRGRTAQEEKARFPPSRKKSDPRPVERGNGGGKPPGRKKRKFAVDGEMGRRALTADARGGTYAVVREEDGSTRKGDAGDPGRKRVGAA